jgi:hypothetical protein
MSKILVSADEASRLKKRTRPRNRRDLLVDGLCLVQLTITDVIQAFRDSTRTTAEIVQAASGLPSAQVTRAHEMRVGAALRAAGLRKSRILGPDGHRRWVWYAPPGWVDPSAVRPEAEEEVASEPEPDPEQAEIQAKARAALDWKPGRG